MIFGTTEEKVMEHIAGGGAVRFVPMAMSGVVVEMGKAPENNRGVAVTIRSEQEQREEKMYGTTVAKLWEGFEQFNSRNDGRALQMYAMSVLSDVQERLLDGVTTRESVRQELNVAKFFMSEARQFIAR